MSTTTSITYGYGVDKNTLLLIQTEKLLEFLKKHLPDDYKMMRKEVGEEIENPSLADYEKWLDGCSFINTGIEGKYSIISTAISEETGFRFEYQDSPDKNESAIMFSECMPWQLNEQEKRCTESDFYELLKKYFQELDVKVQPGKVSVEYYG